MQSSIIATNQIAIFAFKSLLTHLKGTERKGLQVFFQFVMVLVGVQNVMFCCQQSPTPTANSVVIKSYVVPTD